MKYQRPKGTADILPGESEKWQYIEDTARMLFADYCYREIRTPMFENYNVYSRTSGDTSDIVTKEMYDFDDKGDRHIALRPEGTAGVVRAFIENKMYGPDYPKPVKLYYMGPMFRYERPQSGRQREFHQIGAEAFGSDAPELDAEVIAMALDLLRQVGVKNNLRVAINTLGDDETRDNYRQALLDYLEPHFDELSDDSKKRLHKNPLRVLDSKAPEDQQFVNDAPSILDYLSADSKKHFDKVKSILDDLGIDYVVDPDIVRGLDYYTHTIFEIMVKSDALGKGYTTICAGGRYNGLVKQLGGPEVPGVGFGLGVERLILLMEAEKLMFPKFNSLDAYVVGISADSDATVSRLVQALRSSGLAAERDYMNKKPKSQFKMADRLKANYTLTIGDYEIKNHTVHVKSMETGNEVTVPLESALNDFSSVVDENFN